MKQKIVVFGSYVQEFISRQKGLPVPGQTINGSRFLLGYGGKGSNQAVAAHRAGADVTIIAKVGDDPFGRACREFYEREGMDTSYVITDPVVETGSALIMVDEITAQNQIVVVSGACGNYRMEDVEFCRTLIENCDYLLLQHEVNLDVQWKVVDLAWKAGVKIVLNPAPAKEVPEDVMRKLFCVTPNETETLALTGLEVTDQESASRAAKVLLDRGVQNVVITMGDKGAFATDGVREELLPRLDVEAVDTTGAGDAFNGGFITALSEGADLFRALRYGNATGALSVTGVGTAVAMPCRRDIDAMFQKHYG